MRTENGLLGPVARGRNPNARGIGAECAELGPECAWNALFPKGDVRSLFSAGCSATASGYIALHQKNLESPAQGRRTSRSARCCRKTPVPRQLCLRRVRSRKKHVLAI